MGRINFLIVCLLLSACATSQPGIKTEIQKVEIPIMVPCKVNIPVVPNYSFEQLSQDQDIFQKTQALLSDRLLHLAYETELVAALNACVK